MVHAATAAVLQGLRVPDPAAEEHHLVPRFVEAQPGGVDEAAHIDVRKVRAPVIKLHPAERPRKPTLQYLCAHLLCKLR